MELKINKILSYLTSSKLFLQVVGEKISTKAKRSGKSFKEYIHDNENIGHISLVAYDLLPLPFKFAIRYEKFNILFTNNFEFIRGKLFNKPNEVIVPVVKTQKPKVPNATTIKAIQEARQFSEAFKKRNATPRVAPKTPAVKSAKSAPLKADKQTIPKVKPVVKKAPAKKVIKK